jgi:hypothetical protein
MIVGVFNTHRHQQIGHPDKKMKTETSELNYTIDQMDFKNIYKVFDPGKAKYKFFPASCGTFSKIEHILGYKASLN